MRKQRIGYAIRPKKNPNSIAKWSPLDACFLIFSQEDTAEVFLRSEGRANDYLVEKVSISPVESADKLTEGK